MDNLIIQRINEGDTGSVAATKIYNNNKKLRDAVIALKDYLDGYGELVQITVSGGTITIETEPGDSNSSVMTQKATTDFVYSEVNDMCKIGQTIEGDIQMPPTGCFVNAWVSRASANAEGNSLTELYNDVQALKEKVSQLEAQNA